MSEEKKNDSNGDKSSKKLPSFKVKTDYPEREIKGYIIGSTDQPRKPKK
jgi:hypothetical protein